jgi:hypothetical protein
MANLKGIQAKAEIHPQYKTPQRIFDIDSAPSKDEPEAIARRVLKAIAEELQIDSDLSQLVFDQVKKSILGSHVLFQQYHNGKAITGAWVRVDLDPQGKVYNIQNDLVPLVALKKSDETLNKALANFKNGDGKAVAPISVEEAKARAYEATGGDIGSRESVGEESVYFPQAGVPQLAWKILVKSIGEQYGEWKVYVDSVTGAVLSREVLLKGLQPLGAIFDPNPVVTLNDTYLEDTSPIPATAYSQVVLEGLDNSGYLDGQFVTTRLTQNRVHRPDRQFLFARPQRPFKEVMVYVHIDRCQRYVQMLGFDNVLNWPIEANVDGTTDDNSYYSPMNKSLTFGTGGVDDAEDGEIILHEYGHAIQDAILPGFGPSGEARAMGEGFGDYLAASFFADQKSALLKPCVGTWDAVAYSGDEPPNLRRVDSNKKYPRDIVNEEHADGEIWSACLWEILLTLGRAVADRLIIAHHFVLPNRYATFTQAAEAMITADQQLNGGRNEEQLRTIFVRRGFLANNKRKFKRAGKSLETIVREERRKNRRKAKPGLVKEY